MIKENETNKKYSDLILTDDNFDENMEKLADENGYNYSDYIDFVKELPEGFSKQINENGYEEWILMKVYPDHSWDCIFPIIQTILAYEFANGFILFANIDAF